ncbi:hypothetical protein [Pseudomonas putida]|uniref:hypothetical protein n=1 Tax=Pseudomonas putida TaxID=303 RepID=UPI001F52624A|nr:hypothetical protein [Pseudomonas putida]MCI0913678.1 hypothetical protein [Pseudomonas putida]
MSSNPDPFRTIGNHLITEKKSDQHCTIFRTGHQPLAKLSKDQAQDGGPLATGDEGFIFIVDGQPNSHTRALPAEGLFAASKRQAAPRNLRGPIKRLFGTPASTV